MQTPTRPRRLAALVVLALVLAVGVSSAIGQSPTTTTTTTTGATGPTGTTTTSTTTSASTTASSTTTKTTTTSKPKVKPPVNDSYLKSLNLNRPGTQLNDVATLTDTRNITGATVQKDILSPHKGPPEVTGCNGTPEGHTIWYDFYPNLNGLVQIQATASFGTVIAVMPYNPKTALPNNGKRSCKVSLPTNAQSLYKDVLAGTDYTIQIGGVGNHAGEVGFKFDYVVIFKHLAVQTTLEARPTSTGVSLITLTVASPVSATIRVQCSSGCTPETRTGKTVTFPGLNGSAVPAGGTVEIFASAKNEVGQLVEYKIGVGSFMKSVKCLKPNTTKIVGCSSQ